MITVVSLDFIIDNELIATYHFANKTLAELFAQGLYENIKEEKQQVSEFRATEYSVCEDGEDIAITLGKAIGIDDDRITELIEEARKPE
jgi:hypothetical protein